MDKLTLFLVRMLILQCFLHWCSSVDVTVTLESFKRWNTENGFLKAKWDKSKKAFELSFNGSREDDNTTFIFRHNSTIKDPFTIRLAKDDKYLLAVDDNGLVVKKSSDITGDSTGMKNYTFTKWRKIKVSKMTERRKVKDSAEQKCVIMHAIKSQALERRRRSCIKSDKSGLVSWGREDNCGCWIRIIYHDTNSAK